MAVAVAAVAVAAADTGAVQEWRTSPQQIWCQTTYLLRQWHLACQYYLTRKTEFVRGCPQTIIQIKSRKGTNGSFEILIVSSYWHLSTAVCGFSSTMTRFNSILSQWRSYCRSTETGHTKFHADGWKTNCLLIGWLTFRWDQSSSPAVAIHL